MIWDSFNKVGGTIFYENNLKSEERIPGFPSLGFTKTGSCGKLREEDSLLLDHILSNSGSESEKQKFRFI